MSATTDNEELVEKCHYKMINLWIFAGQFKFCKLAFSSQAAKEVSRTNATEAVSLLTALESCLNVLSTLQLGACVGQDTETEWKEEDKGGK
jgi:hypothetical protein